MTAGAATLVGQLQAAGWRVELLEPDFVVVQYEVELGPLTGEVVEIGFKCPPDFDLSAPTGVLVRPHVMPANPNGGEHPWCGVHPCSIGGITDASFQYWSRPHPDWVSSTRDAAALMRHVRQLFATLPDELEMPRAA